MSKVEKKQIREDNEEIEIANIILNEINYFNTPSGRFELEYSTALIENNGYPESSNDWYLKIQELPANTAEEKEFNQKTKDQFSLLFGMLDMHARQISKNTSALKRA